MALAQFVGAEPKPLHGAGAKILHQHVGLCHQPRENLATNGALDIDRQRALAAV